jgi:type IV fimbrial biogenesis protein FimT
MKDANVKGFGLIEQILALLALATLVALAVPVFRAMLVGHELRLTQRDYLAALQHARNLAVNEQVRTLLCPSRDGRTCNKDHAWQGGWLIGRDPGGQQRVSGEPLYTGGSHSSSIRILGNVAKPISFKPDGSSAGTLLRLVFCTLETPPRAAVLLVALRGRIRAAAPEPEDLAKCASGG